MRTAGIVIMVIGLLVTIFTGINFVTQETVVEIGNFEITQQEERSLDWSPLWGVGIIVLGLILYLAGGKK
jgi:hypothetical protein